MNDKESARSILIQKFTELAQGLNTTANDLAPHAVRAFVIQRLALVLTVCMMFVVSFFVVLRLWSFDWAIREMPTIYGIMGSLALSFCVSLPVVLMILLPGVIAAVADPTGTYVNKLLRMHE